MNIRAPLSIVTIVLIALCYGALTSSATPSLEMSRSVLEVETFEPLAFDGTRFTPDAANGILRVMNAAVMPLWLTPTVRRNAVAALHEILGQGGFEKILAEMAWQARQRVIKQAAQARRGGLVLAVFVSSTLFLVLLGVTYWIWRQDEHEERYESTATWRSSSHVAGHRADRRRRALKDCHHHLQALNNCLIIRGNGGREVVGRRLLTCLRVSDVPEQAQDTTVWLHTAIAQGARVEFASKQASDAFDAALIWAKGLRAKEAEKLGLRPLRDAVLDLELTIGMVRAQLDVVTLPLYTLKSAEPQPMRLAG